MYIMHLCVCMCIYKYIYPLIYPSVHLSIHPHIYHPSTHPHSYTGEREISDPFVGTLEDMDDPWKGFLTLQELADKIQ